MRFNTRLLHGDAQTNPYGATLPPIVQSSAFAHESAEQLEKIFENKAPGFAYSRIGNPTVAAFEKRMSVLEGGIDAIACASGMAAVSMALLAFLRSGDEIIAGSGLFGGTLDLLGNFAAFGIKTTFLESVTAEAVHSAVTPNTRVIFAEYIGNPKLDVTNIRAVAQAADAHGIALVVDSTTATPALIRPLEEGAHVVVHSSSKYINGGGSGISGVIIPGARVPATPALEAFQKYGKFAYVQRIRQDIWRNFGPCLAPENAYLNCLGLETLGLRMERLCANAAELAAYLEQQGLEVRYPAIGAILTVRAGTKARAFALINALRYAKIASNIGDVRTLVIHPSSTIYLHSSEAQKRAAGVYDDLIRVSVGIEDIADLKEDWRRAIDAT
ncbi:MAG: PLP-dependent transferase [Oscillospiraceae bacterium]|jgi:O-acetylhomoserine (thiol)-lyase|nr:PLP-dependent transferase [Oscillospiraceae bacterium]